jgi:hypothetical protein
MVNEKRYDEITKESHHQLVQKELVDLNQHSHYILTSEVRLGQCIPDLPTDLPNVFGCIELNE